MPTNQVTRHATTLILLISIVFIMYETKVVLVPLLFSIIFSVMLFPLCLRMEKAGLGKAAASLMSVTIMSLIIFAVLFMLVRQLGLLLGEAPELIRKVGDMFNGLEAYLSSTLGIRRSITSQHVDNQVKHLVDNSGNIFTSVAGFFLNFLADVILIPLYVFFMLYYRDFFVEFFYKLFPGSDKEWIDNTISKLYGVIQNYLLGVVIVMTIIGILNSLGLYFLGIKYAFFFGFFAALLNLIPYVGVMIGSLLPAVLALVTKESYWYAVGAIGVMLFVQLLEGNFITPYVVGSRISINPLIVIFMFMLFGKLWGIAGLILALPMTAIIKVLLETIPACKAYCFILGEPQQYHLKKFSRLHVKLNEKKSEREKEAAFSNNGE